MGIDLRGKPIAITGASSGIGAATALACARAGMPVALGARRADKLDAIVQRITSSGGKAVAIVMDVRSPDDCERFIDDAVKSFGGLYSVYANAGYGEEAPVHEMSDAQVRDMFETNFFGTLSTIRAALPALRSNAPGLTGVRGHVLICSSCLAKMWMPCYAVYSATKAAQNHIGRAMNLELAREGVRVSTIHPIGTRTEFFDVVKAKANRDLISLHTPAAMMQPPELVAAKTLACLRSPRPEVWTGYKGVTVRTLMSIANMLPGLTDWSLGSAMRKTWNKA